jgi:hypothetical protein
LRLRRLYAELLRARALALNQRCGGNEQSERNKQPGTGLPSGLRAFPWFHRRDHA